ncbi:hypothetical protein BN938_0240 [Mucinivorans hirudinis]|uniref:Nucleoside phosphorylase domain-containing protein n=1 Tax=Mucinivorans hirudinis TaxID=1433126 RepID=A0A060R5Z9_9BACT|nr:hypothetical protein BN938_0240 [Mucinivorans hirudinis]
MLIIAATEKEIATCRHMVDCEFVVSGMGASNTAISLCRAVEKYSPNFILQIGIAGAIDKSLALGEAVFVISDYQADLGAWRSEGVFVSFATPKIEVTNNTPFRSVTARSVTTACSPIVNDGSQIESMEGAAFFQAAQSYNIKFAQIRAISNYMDTPRCEWQIEKALAALSDAVPKFWETK